MRTTLTDDELWRAIAKNTETLSGLMQQQLESNGRPGQLKTMLAHELKIHSLERQYRIYSAELLRRGSAERGISSLSLRLFKSCDAAPTQQGNG